MKKLAIMFSLALGAGCGSTEMNPPPPPPPPPPGTTMLSGTIGSNQMLSDNVVIVDDTKVPAGVTLTLKPGTQVTAMTGKGLTVEGNLAVQGTAASPVKFLASGSSNWSGITLNMNGQGNLQYVEIHNAAIALQALGSSQYTIDHLTIDTSTVALTLKSTGSISKTVIHGLGSNQAQSPIQILDASPHFTDVLVDNGTNSVDMIVGGGPTSGPVFDHVEVTSAHCAFHFNQGKNIVISNSYIHGNVYALMNEGSVSTSVQTNNLVQDQINIGSCLTGGSVTATGNYYGGHSTFDGSCSGMDPSPANSMLSGPGYRP